MSDLSEIMRLVKHKLGPLTDETRVDLLIRLGEEIEDIIEEIEEGVEMEAEDDED